MAAPDTLRYAKIPLTHGYVDCYLVHTPFAFQPGDDQDPRDERG
jgi:hypothetical protein